MLLKWSAAFFLFFLRFSSLQATSVYLQKFYQNSTITSETLMSDAAVKSEKKIGSFVIATNTEEPTAVFADSTLAYNSDLFLIRTPSTAATATTTTKSPEIRENFDRTFTLPHPVIRYEQLDSSQPTTLSPTSQNLTDVAARNEDCFMPKISLCNQQAWTDYGLSLSGIIPKTTMCSKYMPTDSCMSTSLAKCGVKMDSMTRHMLIALAKVVVYWCANPEVLAAADEYTSCYSLALIEAVAFDKCLSGVQFPKSIVRAFFQTKKDERNGGGPGGGMIPNLINNLIGGFTTTTLSCMSDTIKGSCGFDAAKFAIGPALDEIEMAKPKSGVKSSYTTLISLLDPEDQFPKNNFTSNYTEQSDSFVQILDFSKSFAPSIIPKFSHFLCVFSALLLLLISLR